MMDANSLTISYKSGMALPARVPAADEQVSRQAFLGVSALLFIVSIAVTVLWCNSMAAMGGMPMPGGWTMSMAWMRMPGQSWIESAGSFLGMWVVMMAAMMLPSVTPVLWRYRQALRSEGESRSAGLTALAALSYFSVWALFGLAVYPVGVALAQTEMEHAALAHAVPIVGGLVVVIAGALQFTKWKTHHLACSREAPGYGFAPGTRAIAACRFGWDLGLQCGLSCANLTAILLVIGVMDLRAMAVATAGITAERLVPGGQRVARIIGVVIVATGLSLIVKAVRLG